jgi:seipin
LNTLLGVLAAAVLLGTAAIAYIIFYYSYIPVRGFSRPVYLQFDPTHTHHPYGVVSIGRDIISSQPYDVHVLLNLPRTRGNRDAGNFMLDLRLLAPTTGKVGAVIKEAVMGDTSPEVLAHSRRPASLTYYSLGVEQLHKAAQLPWYLVGWRKEAELLKVDLMEGVEFARGWRNLPVRARLELSSDAKLQVYEATLVFTARFRGLRYVA